MKPGSALLVTKANAIVEASYRLTLQEQRLVLFCVAQVDSRRPLEEQRTFTVEATPFRETFDLSPEKVYEELKDAAVRLFACLPFDPELYVQLVTRAVRGERP